MTHAEVVPELCCPTHVRADVGKRRGRAAASFVAAAALLACCAVLTSHSGDKGAVLDEAGALSLAESYFPTSAPQQRLSQVAQKTAILPQAETMAMAQKYFPASTSPTLQLKYRAPMHKDSAKEVAPVWPGLADFERHEAALKTAKTTTQSLEWNPNCPCRGGCPCPGHGHGSNIKGALSPLHEFWSKVPTQAPQSLNLQNPEVPTAALKRGLQEGIALGLDVGLKAGIREGLLEVQQPKAAKRKQPVQALTHSEDTNADVSPLHAFWSKVEAPQIDAERRFVKEVQHKYVAAQQAEHRVEAWEAQHEALKAPKHVQLLTGKAEEKYVKGIEKRFAAEEKVGPKVAVARPSEAQEMKKVLSDLKDLKGGKVSQPVANGKVTQPASSTNLPWPFDTALPRGEEINGLLKPGETYEQKDGEYHGHAMEPAGSHGGGVAAPIRATGNTGMVTASQKAQQLDALAAQQASHDSDVDAITENQPFGSDNNKIAKKHLSAKAAAEEKRALAEANHDSDVNAIAAPFAASVAGKTNDFDERATKFKAVEHAQKNAAYRAANPWLSKAIHALHDEKLVIPRTLQQKIDDKEWDDKAHDAIKAMQDAKGDLDSVSKDAGSDSSLAVKKTLDFKGLGDSGFANSLRGVEDHMKELAKEVSKDEQVNNLIHKHKLAARSTQLADFTLPTAAHHLSDADARALGFNGLAGLKAHLLRFNAPTAPTSSLIGEKIPLCTEVHPENCKGVRARQSRDKTVLRGGESGNALGIKGHVDVEDKTMRDAVWKAALKKAQSVGKPAALALGYDGLQQLASHLEREALGLE